MLLLGPPVASGTETNTWTGAETETGTEIQTGIETGAETGAASGSGAGVEPKAKRQLLGNIVILRKFLRIRKIMVMHSNERGECCLRTLVDRKGSVDAM